MGSVSKLQHGADLVNGERRHSSLVWIRHVVREIRQYPEHSRAPAHVLLSIGGVNQLSVDEAKKQHESDAQAEPSRSAGARESIPLIIKWEQRTVTVAHDAHAP